MNFIDHTGHIFQMKSYSIKPIGYEFETTQYVFWFENEYGYKTSVDTYAIKPIRILLDTYDGHDVESIEITVDSAKFSLLSPVEVQKRVEELSSISQNITIDSKLFTKKLIFKNEEGVDNDLVMINNLTSVNNEEKPTKSLVPFYVAVNSPEAGTWQTNVLIHVIYSGSLGNSKADEEWCPITIAGEICDECEELIINGQNVGVTLPKEILKAVYQTSFYGNMPDERLYAQKLKEYLMNYMDIKGQQGNYKSALTSLKWFGWGNKLDAYKLIKTTNEFQAQYIRDNFDLVNDTLYSYRFFKNDALLSIVLRIDETSEDTEGFDFDADFWGEDKPSINSLFDKTIIKHYDEGDLDFYRGYFDFSMNELGLKLCMLKYYYEKYFLPIHLALNSVSMMQTVFANDIKMLSNCYPKLTSDIVFLKDQSINVIFPPTATMILAAETHKIDDNFIEFNDTVSAKYSIYDTLVNVPIKFISKKRDQYYDVILKLYKDDKILYSRNFQFTQYDIDTEEYEDNIEYDKYKGQFNFIIHPKTFNRYLKGNGQDINNKKFEMNLWLRSTYKIELNVNGNNYEYVFNLKMPEMILKVGKLVYQYDPKFRQLYKEDNKLNFLSYMHMPGLVTANNIDYVDDLYFFQDSLDEYIDKYYKTNVNIVPDKYLNVCHLYKIKKNGKEIQSDYEFNINNISISLENNKFVWTNYNEQNKELYDEFFDTSCKNDNFVDYVKPLRKAIENPDKIKYDFYLMREADKNIYYALLISKYTMSTYVDKQLEAPRLPGIGQYKFEYERSDKKFLVNRFILTYPSDTRDFLVEYDKKQNHPELTWGYNHFNDKDIIAFYLETNNKLPYKVGLSSKWEIKPMSSGMSNNCKVESPSEIAIVSIGNTNFKYERGYYDIVCKYSIDDYFQESMTKKAKFVVE